MAFTALSQPAAAHAAPDGRRLDAVRASSRPTRSRTPSLAPCRATGSSTRTTGPSPATTRPAAARRSAGSARRAPTSATPSPPRARSRASTARSRSAAAATWTAASARSRTSTSSAGRGLDLVICLNPLTSSSEAGARSRGGITGAATGAISGAIDLIPSLTRRASRARLEREERKVRRFGTEVVVDRAHRRGPRRDGPQLDERGAPPARDRDGRGDGRASSCRRPEVSALLDGLPRRRAAQDQPPVRAAVDLARAALGRCTTSRVRPAR